MKRGKKAFASCFIAVVLSVLLLIPALATSAEKPKTLTIGIATTLTGPAAAVGSSAKMAIQLAIDAQNKKGGVTIAGQKYMLDSIVLDTKNDPSVGKSVAEELIYDKKVKIIMGPTQIEAFGMQPVTESNKVLLFTMSPTKDTCSPDKPYTFFTGPMEGNYIPGGAFIREFYPEAKTVLTVYADLPDAPQWIDTCKRVCKYYGFEWLGLEKYPFSITDFRPIVSRVLSKKPDIVDIAGSGGAMGGLSCLLIRQLREAGFDGLVWAPTLPPPVVMEEVVPKKYRTGVIAMTMDLDSPIVSQGYKDMINQCIKKYGEPPIIPDLTAHFYSIAPPLFEFLNTQNTMDTTEWMKGFAKYHWDGLWRKDSFWLGKPLFGINRTTLQNFYVSEYLNGDFETKWEAPIPLEMFVEK